MAQIPTDSPTLVDAITEMMAITQANTNVALPGNVVSYNSSTRTATIKPGVHRVLTAYEDEAEDLFEELPAIHNVPVCWPMGRGFKINGSLNAGDPVLLVFMDRDISGWRSANSAVPPSDQRTHHISQAVAIPGLWPNNPPEPTDAAALASKLDAFFQAVAAITPAPLVTPGQVLAAVNTIIAAAATVTGGAPGLPGTDTTGSSILKLDG